MCPRTPRSAVQLFKNAANNRRKGRATSDGVVPQHFPSFTGLRLEVNTISFSLSVLLLNSTITYTSGRIVEFVSRSIHFCFTSFSFEKSEKVCFMVAKWLEMQIISRHQRKLWTPFFVSIYSLYKLTSTKTHYVVHRFSLELVMILPLIKMQFHSFICFLKL